MTLVTDANQVLLDLVDIYDPAYHAFLGFEMVRDCSIKPKGNSLDIT